jgi:hypothetical protein
MEYRIEKLSDKNFPDLKSIYKTVFGAIYSENEIYKKFDTSYLGLKYFGHIAYYQQKPIAFHGAILVQMKHNNQLELSAQYGDAMTLKEHAGKGLFTKLGELTDEQLKTAGIKFVWGFPNQNSEYGYINNLNWKYEEQVKGYKIKIATIPFEKMARKIKFTSKIYDKIMLKFFLKFKTNKIISGSVFLENNVVSIHRNPKFYTYKSFTNNFVIEIHETLFWIKIKNGLLIGDVQIKTNEKFDSALSILKNIAFKIGVSEIIFQTSPNTLLANIMETRANEKFESWKVGYKNFNSNFPLENLKFTFGDLDTF